MEAATLDAIDVEDAATAIHALAFETATQNAGISVTTASGAVETDFANVQELRRLAG